MQKSGKLAHNFIRWIEDGILALKVKRNSFLFSLGFHGVIEPVLKLFKTYAQNHVLNVLISGVCSISIGDFYDDVIVLQLPEFFFC